MSALDVFQYGAHEVRTVLIDGEPWFVAADVTRALGLGNGRDAVSRVDQAGVGNADIRSGGQMRNVSVLNEPALYELVFQSRVPGAETLVDHLNGQGDCSEGALVDGDLGAGGGDVMSSTRQGIALMLACLTVAFVVVCAVRLTVDGFAVLAALSFTGLVFAAGAHKRSFWA